MAEQDTKAKEQANKQADASVAKIPLGQRPKHIAVIMDGNGRWAQQQGLERIEGHVRGVETVRDIMNACNDFGISVLSLYCFSSENWKRPEPELEFLMSLLTRYLIGERETLVKNNLRVRIIGRRDGLPEKVQQEIEETIQACEECDGMTLCLAINYGSRREIVDSIQDIAQRVKVGVMDPSDINETTVSDSLQTAGLPDPDLLIRTSGELRISNFLLWQISYAEIWVTSTLWPAFNKAKLAEAICDFSRRKRRFGGLDPRKANVAEENRS
ncbi:MAG: isoprenyl transferase [Planctomycetota bacterium]